MLKHLLPLLLILSTPLISSAQYDNWHPITPDNCAADILFPDKPEQTTQSVNGINQFIHDAAVDMTMFSLNCSEPVMAIRSMKDTQKYEILIAGAQQRMNSTDVEVHRHNVDGHPAIDYTQVLGGIAKIYHCAVIANGRVYQLSVGDMMGTESGLATLFFNSFKPN